MKRNNIFRNGLFYLIVFFVIIGLISLFTGDSTAQNVNNISSSEFVQQLEDDQIESVSIQPSGGVYTVEGRYSEPQTLDTGENDVAVFGNTDSAATVFTTTLLQNDPQLDDVYALATENGVEVTSYPEESTSVWLSLLVSILPFIIFIGFLYMLMNQSGQGGNQGSGGGRNPMSFGRSTAKQADPSKSTVRFTDVAGLQEEKAELVEVVDFLKDPNRFSKMGARIPAGVLLTGPPGTGKTLLAKAVAGEASVPFYSISGSEFVEMFVGVGASRVRDMFTEAKKNAPAIIFIDEIDAVGRKRGASYGGGNDEREQTLNQLLVEMDGFTGNEGVIVIAATNRSDVLDPALLRPGRFDRQIEIGMPDVREREAILKVHAKNKPLSKDVKLSQVAKTTPGYSGAELENLLNEAALVAARRKSTVINAYDVDEAADRVIAGPAKTERKFNEKERRMVAFHEAGHTVTGLVLNEARVVHKVTIVPRGKAGGYAIMLPREDQYLYTKKDLFEQLVGLLGGRAAEERFFDTQTSGASNDFQQATNLARAMVTQYGMSDKLGTIQYEDSNESQKIRSSYSQETAFLIDEEVKNIIDEAHRKALEIVDEYSEQLTTIAEKLLEVETLNADEIKSLFETGEMPNEDNKPEFPSESEHVEEEEVRGASFDEIKERTEQKENEREDNYSDHHDLDEEESSESEEIDDNDDEPRNAHVDQDRD